MLTLDAPDLQRLYKDWDAWRRGREFPARADFDPCNLRYVLGNVALIDVLRDPLRFRFRLHPTNMVNRLGADLTGKFIDEIADRKHFLLAHDHFEKVIRTRQPVVENRHGVKTDFQVWNCEILVLPLSNNGIEIDMLMGCVIWDEIISVHAQLSAITVGSHT